MSNDLGPIPDSRTSGDPAKKAVTDEAESKVNKIRPDAGDPPNKSAEATETNEALEPPTGAQINSNGPTPSTGDHKKPEEANHSENSWPKLDCSKPHEEIEKAITECAKTKYGVTLVTDMDDAQLLLSYVTRNGLQEDRKVGDETIQTLISSWQHLRAGVFDSEKEEPQFRKSYGILAKAAEPVTVVSLRDSLTTAPYRRWLIMQPELLPVAEIACRRYRNYAFLVLIVLLIAQIYWTVSSSVLSKTDAIISELNRAPTKQYYIAQEAARIAALKAPTGPNAQATPTEPKTDKTQLTLDELVSKRAELEANYSLLDKFVSRFSWLYFTPEQPPATKKDEDKSNPPIEAPAKNAEDIFIPSHFQNESASTRVIAGQLIDVMQKWLLPLLYGALGAMVFVVRTLSVQAKDRLFRKEALVSLVLRVFLGMISGLAIGWFWSSNPPASSAGGPMSVSTLSPFALAFVAGYGVELFFALLDKIVSTFTNKP